MQVGISERHSLRPIELSLLKSISQGSTSPGSSRHPSTRHDRPFFDLGMLAELEENRRSVGLFWPGTLPGADPLAPADNLAHDRVGDLLAAELLGLLGVEWLLERNDGEDVAMRPVAQWGSWTQVRRAHHVGDVLPPGRGDMFLGVFAAVLDVRVGGCGRRGRNAVEKAMVGDQGRDWQVDVLADEDVFLYICLWRRSPAQLGEVPFAVSGQHAVVVEESRTRWTAFGSLERHIWLGDVLKRRAIGEEFGVVAADRREELAQAILEIGERAAHGGRRRGCRQEGLGQRCEVKDVPERYEKRMRRAGWDERSTSQRRWTPSPRRRADIIAGGPGPAPGTGPVPASCPARRQHKP